MGLYGQGVPHIRVLIQITKQNRHISQFRNVVSGPEAVPYACPCCHFLTLPSRGGDEICPVCFWHDDGQDDHDANDVRGGPNYSLSLTKARENFVRLGAADETVLPFIRKPHDDELEI
jgi:hypothetical protein